MKIVIILLRGFAYVWGALAVALIALGLGMTWYMKGFGALQQLLSPFNVVSYLAIALTLAPAFGAKALADKLSRDIAK